MAVIPKPQFPNVPNVPGVPQVSRSNLFPPSPGPIIGGALAIGKLWQSIFAEPQWGIYRALPPAEPDEIRVVAERKPVIKPDSFLEFSYRSEYSVADFPIEDGAFASYDKVTQPEEMMVRMAKTGTKEARKQFIDSIDAIKGDLNLYDIVTPEKTYLDVNVLRYEVSRRGPSGAYGLWEVDLYFREIRTVRAVYSSTAVAVVNARDVSASPVANNGVVQAADTVGSLRAKVTAIAQGPF